MTLSSFNIDPSGCKDKDLWVEGEKAYFEYHCWQSHDSSDAELWYRSHQEVTIIKMEPNDGFDILQDGFAERMDAGHPIAYSVKFKDGFIGHVTEDEFFVDPKFYEPENAAPSKSEIERAKNRRRRNKP